MEGAVRSGYNAAQILAEEANNPHRFLVEDLKAKGVMAWF